MSESNVEVGACGVAFTTQLGQCIPKEKYGGSLEFVERVQSIVEFHVGPEVAQRTTVLFEPEVKITLGKIDTGLTICGSCETVQGRALDRANHVIRMGIDTRSWQYDAAVLRHELGHVLDIEKYGRDKVDAQSLWVAVGSLAIAATSACVAVFAIKNRFPETPEGRVAQSAAAVAISSAAIILGAFCSYRLQPTEIRARRYEKSTRPSRG